MLCLHCSHSRPEGRKSLRKRQGVRITTFSLLKQERNQVGFYSSCPGPNPSFNPFLPTHPHAHTIKFHAKTCFHWFPPLSTHPFFSLWLALWLHLLSQGSHVSPLASYVSWYVCKFQGRHNKNPRTQKCAVLHVAFGSEFPSPLKNTQISAGSILL